MSGGWESAPMRVLFPTAHGSREKLWCGEQRASRGEIGLGRVARLAGVSRTSVGHLDWPQEPGIHSRRKAPKFASGQAAIFFKRFQFSLTYRPGSRNQKPDALSQQHAIKDVLEAPEGIIPRERIIAVVSWEIERQIQEALEEDPDPWTGPQHRGYVPGSVCPQVMQWGHSSQMSCHPGGGRTLGLLRLSFWWPTMERDVQKFVAGCVICARDKALHRPVHQQGYYARCRFLHNHGLTSRWTLLQDFRNHGIYHDTHHSGQVLQRSTFSSTYQTPVSHGHRTTVIRTCASATWHYRGDYIRSRSTVHLRGLASVLSGHRGES